MTEPSAPLGAVIIPHLNDMVRLERCLAALEPQVADIEVVVVDNGSTDDLSPLAQRFDFARFITENQKGAAAARNRGVAETQAPALLFLDCDCVPSDGWVARALTRARAGLSDQVVGGQITLFDETPPPRSGAEAFETVFAFHQEAYIAQKGFSVTANLLTTRAVFEATGPFRPGLSEDADWCWRATATGAALAYDPALRVRHPSRSDWTALKKKWRRLTDESWGLKGRGLGARAGWVARAGAVCASGVVDLRRVLGHPELSGAEKMRGAATLLRLRALRAVWMTVQALR